MKNRIYKRKAVFTAGFLSVLLLSVAACGSVKNGDKTQSEGVVSEGGTDVMTGYETESDTKSWQNTTDSTQKETLPQETAEHVIGQGPTAEPDESQNTSENVSDSEGSDSISNDGETQESIDAAIVINPPEDISAEPVTNGQYVICLDPGHGGSSPGAIYNGYREGDLTLAVAFYCKAYLESNYDVFTVYMTRTGDTEFSSNQKVDLMERANYAASVGADVLVSLHFNATGTDDHSQKGCLGLVSKQPWVTEDSQNLANCILANLSVLGIANNGLVMKDSTTYYGDDGAALDYYAINRNCASLGIPGIIIEHCFLDNPEEVQFVDSEEDLQNLGAADARGIAAFYGY